MTDTVAKRAPEAEQMVTQAAKGRALLGGTDSMRAAGETYLPKFESESVESYNARLNSSWLFNGFRKTVRDMSGRVFDKPVEIAEGAPAQIEGWCENVDLEGRDLSAFARDVFIAAMSGSGVSYIMVDAPARGEDTTRDQAQREGLRPYFVHLKSEDILGWRTKLVGNAVKLAQIRIMETVREPDPEDEFAESVVQQVRVIDAPDDGSVQVRLFRKAGKTNRWEQVEAYTTDAEEITVVPVYLTRTGFMTGEPPLEDLADVNVAHWQSQSDQRNILHFARVPILHGSGRDDDEPLVISAGMATTSRDPQAKLEWVEHNGHAIKAGRDDLKDLEFQMETHGLQLLVARAQSATGEALDAAKETSQLAMMADALKDALEQALIWMGDYGGTPAEGLAVTVNKDFGVSMLTPQEMQAMLMAVNTGNMSRETFLREMARRGAIRADIDPAEEADRIEAEGGGMTDGLGE
ncbi:DUF4055 domain-containing protein [Maritimibacter sp. UBA3975]|uniref:DUF4055 domain-containing protein n=1 Tax=Maritimibacter sp. UBA3975 TaxID=1946833 RepID=UPI000C0A1852|nr:DUF4055 domain-containing protein [Maritimibacter sp. UBA3975]MAM60851.1 hypothetical protein [Maritimibacter sp.]